ncbi:hypothetical protein KCU62_g9241, partial [Aureobasidium sp. EXF-3399]
MRLNSDYVLVGHDNPYLYPVCLDPIPAELTNLDDARLRLEFLEAEAISVFRNIQKQAHKTLQADTDLRLRNKDEIDCLVRARMRTVSVDGATTGGLKAVRESLLSWSIAFSKIHDKKRSSLAQISAGITFSCLKFWFETWRDPDAMLIDQFRLQFEHALNLCVQYIEEHLARTSAPTKNDQSTPSTPRSTPPAFSTGSNVVFCLILIVRHCRTSSVRHRGISILEQINLQGVFDTAYLATYLRTVVEIEEQDAKLQTGYSGDAESYQAHEIPATARLLEAVIMPSTPPSDLQTYKKEEVSFYTICNKQDSGGDGYHLGSPRLVARNVKR